MTKERINSKALSFVALFLGVFLVTKAQQSTNISAAETAKWRSKLYPENWTPGFKDEEGRFLHDFSYAGYHSGLKPIPNITKNIVDITKAPYKANNTGKKDVTSIIQSAIDDLEKAGGGVLYLPAGIYRTSVADDQNVGIRIKSDSIVIRGDGPDKTFIHNTTTYMRGKTLIRIGSADGGWSKPASKQVKLTKDILEPTKLVEIADVSPFKIGDMVIIKSDATPAFKEEHKVGIHWDDLKVDRGVYFLRKIIAINTNNNTIEIDVPTRYFLKQRDNARVHKVRPQISECGIERLSIGNTEHPNPKGWAEEDYRDEGNGSYDVHASHLVKFVNAYNSWAKELHTYKPAVNKLDIHTLSNCLLISESRFVTIEKCNLQKSQSTTGGGNGYMYTLEANDCLIIDCYAESSRHNLDFKGMKANGNVIYNFYSKDGYKASDFHMHLSMANLIDNFTADSDFIDANFRPYGSGKSKHMYSTTESVIWNTKGLKLHSRGMLITSRQFGNGYVIGTSGPANNVVTTPVKGVASKIEFDTSPEDWVEGVGKGETLYPKSLYIDQLEKRKRHISSGSNQSIY